MTDEPMDLISRREAVRRVSAMLGGVALVGGSALWTGCRDGDGEGTNGATGAARAQAKPFSTEEVAFLDEVADTILPDTPKSPGAKAAKVGAFMALMVTDSYAPDDQKTFRDGMKALDDASKKANNNAGFVQATPQQRLALLQTLDQEQKTYTDQRESARRGRTSEKKQSDAKEADARLPDQRKEGGPTPQVATTPAVTADSPPHYFRMMKELALLGYFTSEIGYTKAMRYVESPGRFDPCAPHTPGETSWAPHA
jgi:hypothetical protein